MVTVPDAAAAGPSDTPGKPRVAGNPRVETPMRSPKFPLSRNTLRISALAAGMLASGLALADAHLDTQLLSRLAKAAPTDQLQVVISYEQSGPVTSGLANSSSCLRRSTREQSPSLIPPVCPADRRIGF